MSDFGIERLVVRLLSGPRRRGGRRAFEEGARCAIRLGLAGIFRKGLRGIPGASLSFPLGDALLRAERREIAGHLEACRQAREALRVLQGAGIAPVVVKGGFLAERLWPGVWMRPPGDLDLLLEEADFGTALAVLARAGFRPRRGDAPGRWCPTVTAVGLQLPAPGCGIDLHTRLYRSVGSGIDSAGILARARPARFHGVPVRTLDPPDEILHLAIHAVVHGTLHPKWLLDLHLAAMHHPADAWREASRRALLAQASRPFWAGVQGLLDLPGFPLRDIVHRLRPSPVTRMILRHLTLPRRWPPRRRFPRLHGHALQWCLEERAEQRTRRLAGLLERRLRRAIGGLFPGVRRPAGRVAASHRWIQESWRNGRQGPLWLTLRGNSMAPGLRDGDRLLAAPFRPGEEPREGAVVIAGGPAGLVAHRLVERSLEIAVTRGDACPSDDTPMPLGDLLAKVIAVDPGGSGEIRRFVPEFPEVHASHFCEVTHGADR